MNGIDWWSVATALTGSSLIFIGGVIVRKINKVLEHVATFARHIDECEQRNENHTTIHRMQEQEIHRRLELLERSR